MSEQAIEALQAKRTELVNQIKELQLAVFHIDGALVALGARPGKKMKRNFRNGELVALIGEAERAGHDSLKPITEYVMRKKGLDMTDESLLKRIRWSVRECRQRTGRMARASAAAER